MAINTEISIIGDGANNFVTKKGIQTLDDVLVEYWLVEATNNREVVVYSNNLHRKGRKDRRKVSINREGVGTQQITTGVLLVIKTDAPVAVFAKNRR